MARRTLESARGAILIHVGLALLVLTGMCAFVLDYGVMWMSRRQAQNAADAGALAGAIARGFDETANPPAAGGPAYQSAYQAAQANPVFGAVPSAVVTWDCPPFMAGQPGCVQVDVFRDGTNGSTALPTWFASVFGVTSQGIKATATAQASPANASDCLRPFAVPDKWIENRPAPGPWLPTSTFERYATNGNSKGQLLTPADSYTPPSTSTAGSGFTIANDYGQQMTLKTASGPDTISPGWFQPVDVPRADDTCTGIGQGGACYRSNIASCSGVAVSIGDYLPTETGNMIGPTSQGIAALIAQDPGATWNSSTQTVTGSCAPECAPISPRIVALPVFDPDTFQYSNANNDWSACPTGGSCVKVTNILGFFVAGMQGNDVIGYLIRYPGVLTGSPGGVGAPSSFATVIRLVR